MKEPYQLELDLEWEYPNRLDRAPCVYSFSPETTSCIPSTAYYDTTYFNVSDIDPSI